MYNVSALGGSSSQDNESNGEGLKLKLFHDNVDVKWVSPATKRIDQFRLLPAFDSTYAANDPARALSHIPYRDRGKHIKNTNIPEFTNWFYIVKGHSFFGPNSERFSTPASFCGYIGDGKDPIMDMYTYLKALKDPTYNHLWDTKVSKTTLIKIPKPTLLANVLHFNDKTSKWENKVLILGKAATKDLLEYSLTERRGLDDNQQQEMVVSQAWGEYLLGDPTSVTDGCYATTVNKIVEGNYASGCLGFFDPKLRLKSRKPFPIDVNTEEGRGYLAGRYDLERVIRIMSYEEVVDMVVADNIVPYNIVQAACSMYYKGVFPAQVAVATHSVPTSSSGFQANVGTAPVPTPGAAPLPTHMPPPTPAYAQPQPVAQPATQYAPVPTPASTPTPTPLPTPPPSQPVAPQAGVVGSVEDAIAQALFLKFTADPNSLSQEEAGLLYESIRLKVATGKSSIPEVTAIVKLKAQYKL
jgi:hypothetical protein